MQEDFNKVDRFCQVSCAQSFFLSFSDTSVSCMHCDLIEMFVPLQENLELQERAASEMQDEVCISIQLPLRISRVR